jgi:hypothetical protein
MPQIGTTQVTQAQEDTYYTLKGLQQYPAVEDNNLTSDGSLVVSRKVPTGGGRERVLITPDGKLR